MVVVPMVLVVIVLVSVALVPVLGRIGLEPVGAQVVVGLDEDRDVAAAVIGLDDLLVEADGQLAAGAEGDERVRGLAVDAAEHGFAGHCAGSPRRSTPPSNLMTSST